jgi:hypothetical protein
MAALLWVRGKSRVTALRDADRAPLEAEKRGVPKLDNPGGRVGEDEMTMGHDALLGISG